MILTVDHSPDPPPRLRGTLTVGPSPLAQLTALHLPLLSTYVFFSFLTAVHFPHPCATCVCPYCLSPPYSLSSQLTTADPAHTSPSSEQSPSPELTCSRTSPLTPLPCCHPLQAVSSVAVTKSLSHLCPEHLTQCLAQKVLFNGFVLHLVRGHTWSVCCPHQTRAGYRRHGENTGKQ